MSFGGRLVLTGNNGRNNFTSQFLRCILFASPPVDSSMWGFEVLRPSAAEHDHFLQVLGPPQPPPYLKDCMPSNSGCSAFGGGGHPRSVHVGAYKSKVDGAIHDTSNLATWCSCWGAVSAKTRFSLVSSLTGNIYRFH